MVPVVKAMVTVMALETEMVVIEVFAEYSRSRVDSAVRLANT